MKIYENDFVYGKGLLKKILILAVISCVTTLLLQAYPAIQLAFFILTIATFVSVFVVIYKYCRCSHCGKVIVLGVMAVTSCPRCKRNLVTGKKVKKSKR